MSAGRGKSKKSLTNSDLKSGGLFSQSAILTLKKIPLNDRRNAFRTILSNSGIICERFPTRLCENFWLQVCSKETVGYEFENNNKNIIKIETLKLNTTTLLLKL